METGLPKDAEGREIPLDTKVLYDRDGFEVDVRTFAYFTHTGVWRVTYVNIITNHDPSDKYLTPPDSWEKLDVDLDRCIEESNLCMYYNQNSNCNNCTISGNETRGCTSIALEDIKKRIRKLRGEDE